MPKPLKLDRDGKLAIPESSVEATVYDFLRAEGWTVIETKAENTKRSGAPAHKRGTLDAVALRIRQARKGSVTMARFAAVITGVPERPECLFLELKRRKARTESGHLKRQTDTARDLRKQGFTVYQASEKDSAPIESFRRWYRERFGGGESR